MMHGASGEQVQSVRQQRKNGAERRAGSGGAAGKVDDQRAADGTADGAAERGELALRLFGCTGQAWEGPGRRPVKDFTRTI